MAVNQWIRSSGAFDAVVDFEAATRDPDHPKQFRPGFNNGDHLHPNDAGYQAMADAIDLSIFGLKALLQNPDREGGSVRNPDRREGLPVQNPDREGGPLDTCVVHTRSSSVAMPCPTPMHMDAIA